MPAARRARKVFVVDAVATQRLEELAARAEGSFQTTWRAVVAVLVHRYQGEPGTLMGASDESAPFDVAADASFATLLSTMAGAAGESRGGATRRLVVELDAREHLSLPISAEGSDEAADRSIVLTFEAANRSVRGTIDYEPRAIDEHVAVRLGHHVRRIAKHVGAHPSTPVSRVPMLADDEHGDLLALLTGEEPGYPDAPVHELFARVAARCPDAPALVADGASLTFRELDERANRLACRLQELGVGPGVAVGLCARRSPAAVVGVMGILKSGGAYVALDSANPSHRLSAIVREISIGIAVADRERAAVLPPMTAVLTLQEFAEPSGVPAVSPRRAGGLDTAAYVMYTSGSSGGPKAIVGSHRSIVNGLNATPFRRDDPREICCLNSSLSFGMSLARLFLPLLCGLPVVIVPEGLERDLMQLVDAWERGGITNIAMVTPVLRQLLALGPAYTSRLYRVHTVVVGGDVLTADMILAFRHAMPQATLLNGYASTEVGGAALVRDVTAANASGPQSVGRPFPNTRVYVTDPCLNLLPVGVAGELCVSAAHLTLGYLNDPALTARHFVPDPFRPVARLCRTGDRARVLPNGEVQLLGRIDDRVKVRGFRIDVREVEGVLAAHEDVVQAAVTAQEWEGEKRLVAHVVRAPSSHVTVSRLRLYMSERLPQYMLPSLFTFVDSLPTTSTGKVDRRALPAPDTARPILDTPYEAPRTACELAMADIWTRLLGIDRIGVHDHFLEVGGDSFFATLLMVAMADRFGIQVREVVLFERPTIAALASYVEGAVAPAPAGAAGM